VSARDVTEQEARDRILSSILENTTTPLFMKDRNGEYITVNQGFRDLFGLQEEEVIGRTDTESLPPEQAAVVQQNDRAVIERGEPVETGERIVTKGTERVFVSSKVPVYSIGTRSDPETPIAVFGITSEITDESGVNRR